MVIFSRNPNNFFCMQKSTHEYQLNIVLTSEEILSQLGPLWNSSSTNPNNGHTQTERLI